MAKNKSRKSKPAVNTKKTASGEDALNTVKEKASEPVKTEEQQKNEAPKKAALFQLKTKRTSDILKAYITFIYRVMHPGVTTRLIFYGVLVAAPGIFFFKDLYWKIFFITVGILLILLGFFRQYISLSMTKKNDPDYQSGAEFTYDFYESSAAFSKNGEVFSRLARYKDITAFYYDEGFFYLAIAKEVHVLPKDAFTVGTAEDFEEFIYKKSKKTCKWLPNKLSDRMKKRRVERAIAAENMGKK